MRNIYSTSGDLTQEMFKRFAAKVMSDRLPRDRWPEAESVKLDDPDHDSSCSFCGSKYCEGECNPDPKPEAV